MAAGNPTPRTTPGSDGTAPGGSADRSERARRGWTFLSNHAHVLLCLAADPEMRLRDIAHRVGITERAAQWIVNDLEGGGYLERERVGRRNRYTLRLHLPMRHPLERERTVSELIDVLRPVLPD